MEHPVCALCGKPITPTDNKMTVQGMAQHMRCLEGAEIRQEPEVDVC